MSEVDHLLSKKVADWYLKRKVLGEGTYGVVYKAIDTKVRNSELTKVSRTEFMTLSAFIFLYENQLFLTFRNRMVVVWNFREELVTSFEDYLLWHPDCNTNNIFITSDQDLIISYRKADSNDPLSERNGKSRSPELNFLWVETREIL